MNANTTTNENTSSALQTIAGGDPAQERPAGASSISSVRSPKNASRNETNLQVIEKSNAPEAQPKKIRSSAIRLVRPDYHRQVKISYAEAALIAGVSTTTMQNWVAKRLIPRVAKAGSYRIYRPHLDKYLETGMRVEA